MVRMGIIKRRPPETENENHSLIFSQSKCQHHGKIVLERAYSGYYNDYELAEVGYEYVTVRGKKCGILYELYDLPDLKCILSLETWNHHLTEDERLALANFLPDMDQETFVLTLKELLTGDAMFFGSPLEKFYNELKGGLYSPQITHLRESLRYLQRNEYYHTLRSYHQRMYQKLIEMGKIWNGCQPHLKVEERIQIWNSRRDQEPVFVFDLSTLPDNDILNKGGRNVGTLRFSKKSKYMDNNYYQIVHLNDTAHDTRKAKDNNYYQVVHLNDTADDTKRKAKGVLKLIPTGTNLMQNQMMQAQPHTSGKPSIRLPKGVLKIKPKYSPFNEEKSIPKAEEISTDIWCGHVLRSLPSHLASKRDELLGERLPLFNQKDIGNTYRKLDDENEWQKEAVKNAGCAPFKDPNTCLRKPKITVDATDVKQGNRVILKDESPLVASKILQIYSLEACKSREFDIDRNTGNSSSALQSKSIYESCEDAKIKSYEIAFENCHTRGVKTTILEAGSRMPNNANGKHANLPKLSDPLDHCNEQNSSNEATSEDKQGFLFPITYKRKKPFRKLSQVDSPKQQPIIVNLEPAAPVGILKSKPVSIKIKFRGLTG